MRRGFAFVLLLLGACHNPVQGWTARAARRLSDMSVAWNDLEFAMRPWLRGAAVKEGDVEYAFTNYQRRIKELAEEIREAPPGDDACGKLHEALVAYADAELAGLELLEAIVADVKESNPPDEATAAEARSAMKPYLDGRKKLISAIRTAEARVSVEHGVEFPDPQKADR